MLSYDLFKKYCFFQLFLSFFRALTALASQSLVIFLNGDLYSLNTISLEGWHYILFKMHSNGG